MGDKMENVKQLYEERLKRLNTALANGKPDRVPIFSQTAEYVYRIQGIKPLEAYQDLELMKKAYRYFYSQVYFDGFQIPVIGKGKLDTLRILGGGTSEFLADGSFQTKPGSINIMDPGEYGELIENPPKFFIEKIMPRRFKLMAEEYTPEKYDRFVEAVKSFLEGPQLTRPVTEMLKNELGIVELAMGGMYAPVDIILDFLRDFNGMAQDVRRRPAEVRDAGLAIMDWLLPIAMLNPPDPDKFITVPMHLPAFLRPQDFEKVYWPSFQKFTETLVEKGYKLFFLFEGKYEHLHEYMQELPKNKVAALFEHDDLQLVKKSLGDTLCIVGGMPTNMLYYKTKEECIAHVKNVLDTVALDGGFIFSADKPMLAHTDGTLENFKAVNEFVHNYGIYR